jgi:hypothetical protein
MTADHQTLILPVEDPCLVLYYHEDRGLRTTSCQISFEFLFIKTCPPDKLHNGTFSISGDFHHETIPQVRHIIIFTRPGRHWIGKKRGGEY